MRAVAGPLALVLLAAITVISPARAAPAVDAALQAARAALAAGNNQGALGVLEPAWQAMAGDPGASADDRLRLADALVSRLLDAQRFADADAVAARAMPALAQARDVRIAAEAQAVFAVPAIRLGRAADAERLLVAAEALRQRIAGDSRGLQAAIAQRRVVALASQGRMAEAAAVLEPLVPVVLADDFPDPARGLVIPQTLAGLFILQGRHAEGAAVLERMRSRALALWTSPRQRAEFLETLGEAYRGTQQNDRARAAYLDGLAELARGQDGMPGGITITQATLNANIARVSLLLGDPAEAVARADQAVALMRQRAEQARDAQGTLSALDLRMLQLLTAIALDVHHAARKAAGPQDDAQAFRLMQEALLLQQPAGAPQGISAIAAVRSALRPDEVLMLLLQGTDAIHVMGLTTTGMAWHRLEQSSAETCPRFARLRAGLAPAQPLRCTEATGPGPDTAAAEAGFDLAAAHALWRDLFAPLGPGFTGQPRWILATAGTPTALPLGVLLTEAPASGGFGEQPWLGARRALSYLPSVAELVRLRALPAAAPARHLLAMGAPCIGTRAGPACTAADGAPASVASRLAALGADFTLTRAGADGAIGADAAAILKLPALPSAAGELLGLARDFRGRSRVLLAGDATEARARRLSAPAGAVVAFATHGLAGDGLGLAEPALVFTPGAGGREDDGLLLASDVTRLPLPDSFVILSACNMAGVRSIERLDAYQGFARAFFTAGARALLISQFEVLDAGAARLTTGMLTAWQKKRVGRAEALRQSIARMLADPAAPQLHHPRAWASMILVGAPD